MEGFFGWMLESSLLVLMLLGIRRVFMGRIRYAGIYALWLVILVRFMIPINIISVPFSVGNVFSHAVSSWSAGKTQEQPDSAGSPAAQAGRQESRNSSTEAYSDEGTSANRGESAAVRESGRLSRQDVPAKYSESWQKLINDEAWQKITYVRTVVSGLLFLWLFLSNLVLLGKLKRERKWYGSRGRVHIYASSHIKNPCLYGFIRPAIYIPGEWLLGEQAVRAETGELEQMITHEYVHYLHRDHLWAMFRMLLVSVYWYHPFLWLAVSCSKKDAELFCDETVIGLLGEEKRFSYGEMLVRLAGEARWGDFRYSLTPMSRRGKEMEKRIRAISDRRKYSSWAVLPLFFAVCAAAGITCSTGVTPLAHGSMRNQTQKEEKNKQTEEREEKRQGNNEKSSPGKAEELFSKYSEYVKQETAGKGLQERQKTVQVDGMQAAGFSSTYQEAFRHYIDIFTEAVNTGNTDKMNQVLAPGSQVYEQQCNLARNYHKRGIREKVRGVSISYVTCDDSMRAEIVSREKIKVTYGDGTSKIVRQQYRYTCINLDENWIITAMDEISDS